MMQQRQVEIRKQEPVVIVGSTPGEPEAKPFTIEYIKDFAQVREQIPFSNADVMDVHTVEWYQRIDCINNGIVKNITVFTEPHVTLYENVVEVYSDELIVAYRFGKEAFNIVYLSKRLEKQERDMYTDCVIK